jgi:hypothetical protein
MIRKHADAKELRKEMTRGIREELRPVVQAVKSGYGGGKHLRPALRRATRMQVRTTGRQAGAKVMVDGRKMPDGMRSLPAYREGEKSPWRHPTFGRRGPKDWVNQAPHPVFYETVKPYIPKVNRRIEEIVTDIANKMQNWG